MESAVPVLSVFSHWSNAVSLWHRREASINTKHQHTQSLTQNHLQNTDLLSQENQKNGTEIMLTLPFLLSRPFILAFLWQAKTRGGINFLNKDVRCLTGTTLHEHPVRDTCHLVSPWATCFSDLFKRVLQGSKGLRNRKTEKEMLQRGEARGSR